MFRAIFWDRMMELLFFHSQAYSTTVKAAEKSRTTNTGARQEHSVWEAAFEAAARALTQAEYTSFPLRKQVWVKPSSAILFSYIFKFVTSFAEFLKVTRVLAYIMQYLSYYPSLHFHTMQQLRDG